MGWVVNSTPRPLYSANGPRYPLYRKLVEPQSRPGRVQKISPSTGIRSLDRPARSESLYQLRYPGPPKRNCNFITMNIHYPDAHVGERVWLCLILVCLCVFWCAHNSLFRLLHAGTFSWHKLWTKTSRSLLFLKCNSHDKPVCFLRCMLLENNCLCTAQ
jgi:hypothetical protein